MREIKFRAWDKARKEWWRDLIFIRASDGKCMLGESTYEPPIETGFVLMQYTGLKDKNGKEIYESNLIIHHSRNGGKPHLVIFDLKQAAWCGDYGLSYPLTESELREVQNVGNIYQNPELLKDK